MLTNLRLCYYFSLSANFAILGLKGTNRMEDVKKKYYELAKIYHPDVNAADQNAHKKFAEITKVWTLRHRPISILYRTSIKKKDISNHPQQTQHPSSKNTPTNQNSKTKNGKKRESSSKTTKISLTTTPFTSRTRNSESPKQGKTYTLIWK